MFPSNAKIHRKWILPEKSDYLHIIPRFHVAVIKIEVKRFRDIQRKENIRL